MGSGDSPWLGGARRLRPYVGAPNTFVADPATTPPMRRLLLLLSLAIGTVTPAPAPAQSMELVVRAVRAYAGRAELDSVLAEMRRAAASARERESARLAASAAALEGRLATGDFRVGDLVVIELRSEATRLDTATVGADLAIRLTGFPLISLRGVLLSELQGHVAREIAQYVRNVQTVATPLRRVGVFGAVANPGFHLVKATAPVSEMMTIGRPSPDADPKSVTVSRAGRTIVDRAEVAAALQYSLSFAGLGIESGDMILVGRAAAPVDRNFWFQIIGVGVGLITTWAFIRT